MIPLVGHTRGHTGVAVQARGDKWLLHCGDAYYHHSQVTPRTQYKSPGGSMFFQRFIASLPEGLAALIKT